MYNQGQKEKFIREFTEEISMRDAAQRLFDSLEPFEQAWGADLCTRSADELQPAFDAVAGVRDSSKHRPLYILRAYAMWCMEQNIPGARNEMRHIDGISSDKLSRSLITTPARLQWYLNQICDPDWEQTADNNVRTYLWMAYAGMQEEDIFCVKASDVDFRNAVIRYGGETYPIYREALTAFQNCVDLTQFVYKNDNYKPDKTYYRERVPGDILLRGHRSIYTAVAMRVEHSRHAKRARDAGKEIPELSYYRVWLSGVFYRMWEREQRGEAVDFSGVVHQTSRGKVYKMDSGRNTQAAKIRKLEKEFQTDYQRWKQTIT